MKKRYRLYRFGKIQAVYMMNTEEIKIKMLRGEVLSHTDPGNAFLLLLGGYKGKLLSHTFKGEAPDSAVYVDYETKLPHGLAVLELI